MAKGIARKIEMTATASADFLDIMAWSEAQFGERAADRYEELIARALSDLSDDAFRQGSLLRAELLDGIYSYHLRHSRDASAGETVKRPRHFLLYRVTPESVIVLRLLHDSRDLERHLPQDS